MEKYKDRNKEKKLKSFMIDTKQVLRVSNTGVHGKRENINI